MSKLYEMEEKNSLEIIKLYNDFIKDAPDKIKEEVKYYE